MAQRTRRVPGRRGRRSSLQDTESDLVGPLDTGTAEQRAQQWLDNDQAAQSENNSIQGASEAGVTLRLERNPDEEPEETVEEQADGSAIIRKRDRRSRPQSDKHFANLAEDEELSPRINALAQKLWQEIDVDIQAEAKATEKYGEALNQTGQTGKAPGGAQFNGASTVTHPILGEVCADYTARVLREMLPPKGPAKPHIEGVVTREKYDRAKRVSRWMNFYLRRKVKNFASEMEQAFAQQPFAGASYVKPWVEGNRIRFAMVPFDKVHRPASADDFYDCERITHEMTLTRREIETAMRKGQYVKHEFGSGVDPDTNKAEEVAAKVEGIEEPAENIDATRPIYETSCWSDLETEDGEKKPYIITFDKETKFVLSFYRNWEKDDQDCERLDFIYEFGFWPFRDGKPIGLAHMVAGLPRAATGALRASLDSALARIFPGAYKLKGGQSGSNVTPDPGTVQELENATGVDDIRKLVMPVDAGGQAGSDQMLFQLLGFLVDATRGVVRTTFDDIIGKGRQDIPVGTMMMLVDEGTVVYSSVFGRQHRSMGRLLEGLYRRARRVVKDVSIFEDSEGTDRVTLRDFDGDAVVAPVSDPRINSDTQRYTRANFVNDFASKPENVGLVNRYEAAKNLFEAVQIENIDQILIKPQMPSELSAVNENVAATLGRPISAYPEQNHLAHLEQHADFMLSPIYGAHAAFQPALTPIMVGHFKEHMVMAYAATTLKIVDGAIAKTIEGKSEIVKELRELMADAQTQSDKLSVIDMIRMKDPELGRSIDLLFAAASRRAIDLMQRDLVKIAPLLQQMNIMAQQFKPPMPTDPSTTSLQVASIGKAAAESTAQIREKGNAERTQLTLQHKTVEADKDRAAEAQRLSAELGSDEQDRAVKHQMNTEDNVTALTITNAEIAAGEKVDVSTGTGLGANPGGD